MRSSFIGYLCLQFSAVIIIYDYLSSFAGLCFSTNCISDSFQQYKYVNGILKLFKKNILYIINRYLYYFYVAIKKYKKYMLFNISTICKNITYFLNMISIIDFNIYRCIYYITIDIRY